MGRIEEVVIRRGIGGKDYISRSEKVMKAFETRKCVEVEEVLGQELKQMSRYSINGEPAPAWCVFLHMHHCKLICAASIYSRNIKYISKPSPSSLNICSIRNIIK